MSTAVIVLIVAFMFFRALGGGRYRREWRQGHPSVLHERVAKLEVQLADLQEQLEQERASVSRLEEERDFLKALYPAVPARSAEARKD